MHMLSKPVELQLFIIIAKYQLMILSCMFYQSNVTWASQCLLSPAYSLFVTQLFQDNNKENSQTLD